MKRSTSQEQRTRGADYEAPAPVPKTQRTRGRPSEYDEAVLPEVVELLNQGATSREVLNHLGVSSGTFWRWCAAYPELRNAVKAAKAVQDDRVEDALRINAVLEGNVTAQIFWLKNRRPDEWRERNQTELIVPVDDNPQELDHRSAALAALALFNSAVYDPTQPAGPVIEGHAREEIGHGEENRDHSARSTGQVELGGGDTDPDFDGHPFDLDPGEV